MKNYFKNLPDEIVMIIFSYLKNEKDFLAFAKTCNQMWQISQDKNLWKSLYLTNVSTTPVENFRDAYISTYSSLFHPIRRALPVATPIEGETLAQRFNDGYRTLLATKKSQINIATLSEFLKNMLAAYSQGNSALHDAAATGQHQLTEVLLLGGLDPNLKNEQQEIPLHRAVLNEHHDIAKLLLQYGAQANSYNISGVTALHWACMNMHSELVHLLLTHKADPNQASIENEYPLLCAMSPFDPIDNPQTMEQIIKLLLLAGANPDGISINGPSPLSFAAIVCTSAIPLLLLAGATPMEVKNNDMFNRAMQFLQIAEQPEWQPGFHNNNSSTPFFSKQNLKQILEQQPDLACFFFGQCIKREIPDVAASILPFIPAEYQVFAKDYLDKTTSEPSFSNLQLAELRESAPAYSPL